MNRRTHTNEACGPSLGLTTWMAGRAALLGMLLMGVARAESAGAPPTSMPAGVEPYKAYAGSYSCAECHQEAYDDWRTSHHALAQRPVSPTTDQDAFDPPRLIPHGSEVSLAQRVNDRYSITTVGPDGRPQAYEPVEVIGHDPLRQYLIPWPGGRVQVTELAFDPAKLEWFNVYGEENRKPKEWGHWTGRGMNWNSMCATCHTTGFHKNYDAKTDAYRTTYLELGIGCEQCHGPMRDHGEWQTAHRDQEGDPTLRPFDRERYINTCAACHSRRAELTGRFMPGDDFHEHFDLVLPDTSEVFYPDGQIHDEDFEYAAFSLSAMHAWGVRCTDCHDWHTVKVTRKDNRLCLRCHQQGIAGRIPIDEAEHSHHPPDAAGFACFDCHMPQTAYMQRHWRHDHGMTIPDPLLTKEHGIPNACTRCHADEEVDWSLYFVEEWYGKRMDRPTRDRARALARLKAHDLSAVPEALALLHKESNPTWRAVYARMLAPSVPAVRDPATRSALIDALADMLNAPSPVPQAAAIEALDPFAPLLTDRLRPKLDSPSRLVRVKTAWLFRQQLDLNSLAGRDLMAYLNFNQDQPLGAFQRANLLADRGQPDQALPWYEKAIRWDPGPAMFNHAYAISLHNTGRSQDAVEQLKKATAAEPDQAAHPYSLALLYGELGHIDQARDALRQAVERDPAQSRYWYNLALAENQLADPQAAIRHLHKAEELDPGVADYPYARATILHQLGQIEEARDALQRTLEIDPNHPQARALLTGRTRD